MQPLPTISDTIELFLKEKLNLCQDRILEIQRNLIAEEFKCSPSQINYVINTRFTLQRGFSVESKRGGGGFIRIRAIHATPFTSKQIDAVFELIGHSISQAKGEDLINFLFEYNMIDDREKLLMRAAISRNNFPLDPVNRDLIRASILRAMVSSLF